MESIAPVIVTCAHVLIPAFFWIRGILNRRDSDTNLAIVLVYTLAFLRLLFLQNWLMEPMRETGLIVFGMGIILIVLGPMKKIDATWKIVLSSIVLMILGFIMFAAV